ncbi:hypothetical protein X945_1687 [Burkholderia pseudomallei ABCPW 107]|nr:hypothetical protein DP56_1851 [Burkholderia pseudomallei]KGS35787.1 hypothetical protein X945_1687 [Burkholderia pseudomallei ABCPW 107]KGX56217.1 hypothetical protein Y025_904 [Burkholderia pseudomallei TSV32]
MAVKVAVGRGGRACRGDDARIGLRLARRGEAAIVRSEMKGAAKWRARG